MIAMSRLTATLSLASLSLALFAPVTVQAQSLPYGDVGGSGGGDAISDEAEEGSARSGKRIEFSPYVEAGLTSLFELSPGNDTVTYSVVAAGVDASVNGRNNQASVSLRYERRFGISGDTRDSDTVSGVARYTGAIVPGALQFEAGALAARTSVENSGATIATPLNGRDAVSQVYSAYAGPTVNGQVGDVAVTGGYRLGYTRVESPDAIVTVPGQAPVDVFDDSVSHNAALRAGVKPGEVLPVGVGVGVGYNREDISNLDQRVEDFSARGDVTLPVGNDLSLVAGLGYEKVQVSSRDALRDPVTGLAVIGTDGRLVTDSASPRVLAYDVNGLIWDAGVIWRPSRRTAFEAHVGRRYGTTSYFGSFAYAPNTKSSLNISVYDSIQGFGGQVNSALAALPSQFQASRNPLTGDINACVIAQAAGSCLGGALGSVRSSIFRSRGVSGSYSVDMGRLQAGVAGGYDRRTFIAAPGTVLASANGVIDENIWLAAYLAGKIDRSSGFSTNFYANRYESGDTLGGDVAGIGATAAYYRTIMAGLTATAAVGVDGINRDALLEDQWTASALVGVRYTF
jgi:hypothetical protein